MYTEFMLYLRTQVNENTLLRDQVALLNQHKEDATKQHAESSLRSNELEAEIQKVCTFCSLTVQYNYVPDLSLC